MVSPGSNFKTVLEMSPYEYWVQALSILKNKMLKEKSQAANPKDLNYEPTVSVFNHSSPQSLPGREQDWVWVWVIIL
jgi:hypothetical protein